MIKKTITYVDFDGVSHTDTYYFNLSKVELVKLDASYEGGFEAHMKELVDKANTKDIFDLFTQFITMSYGEKSADGKRFIKSAELTESFVQSNAFDELLIELMQNTTKLEEFIKGLVPSDISAAIQNRQTVAPEN